MLHSCASSSGSSMKSCPWLCSKTTLWMQKSKEIFYSCKQDSLYSLHERLLEPFLCIIWDHLSVWQLGHGRQPQGAMESCQVGCSPQSSPAVAFPRPTPAHSYLQCWYQPLPECCRPSASTRLLSGRLVYLGVTLLEAKA